MNRVILTVAMGALVVACGSPGEVAPTTTAPPVDDAATTTTTTRATTTTTVASTSTIVDEGDHDDADHEDEGHGDEGHEDDGHDDDQMGDIRTIEVTMTEFAFAPDSVDVSAGETVRFLVTNEGVIEHELRLSNEHRIEEHLASGHEDHGGDGHHSEGGDVLVLVAAGETAELVVEFSDDTTVYTMMACLIPGHYEAGMLGALDYV